MRKKENSEQIGPRESFFMAQENGDKSAKTLTRVVEKPANER
jgi:hypothetical protein